MLIQQIQQIPQNVLTSLLSLSVTLIFAFIGILWRGIITKNKEQDEKINYNATVHNECQLKTQESIFRIEKKVGEGFATIAGDLKLLSQQIDNGNGNGKHN